MLPRYADATPRAAFRCYAMLGVYDMRYARYMLLTRCDAATLRRCYAAICAAKMARASAPRCLMPRDVTRG